MFQDAFPLSIYYLLKSFTILSETWTIKRQQMAKMNDRVPKERLGTSRLNHFFLKIYPRDPTSKFQKLAISSGLTFMQSKIKIWKTDFSQTKKMWNQK